MGHQRRMRFTCKVCGWVVTWCGVRSKSAHGGRCCECIMKGLKNPVGRPRKK